MTLSLERTTTSRLPDIDFNNLGFGQIFTDHMLEATYEKGQWTNVCIRPFQPLSMLPSLSCIHYGQAIFEGLKAYRNPDNTIRIFRPKANWQRLNLSAKRLSMPEVPAEIFLDGLYQLLDLDREWIPTDENSALYIRPFMFATDTSLRAVPSQSYKFMIILSPVGAYYSAPVRLKIETEYTRAAKGGVGFAKNAGNYAASFYPTMLAREQGFDQVIWTDSQTHEYIEEAGVMNIMFVINNTLITPAKKDSILEGITRDSLLTLARHLNIPVEERDVSINEVIQAIQSDTLQEMFGAGTAAVISPIAAIGYKDQLYELKERPHNALSHRLYAELEAIKRGAAKDPFNWSVRC